MQRVLLFLILTGFAASLFALEITFKGEPLIVKGGFPAVDEEAPQAHVKRIDFSVKTIGGKQEKVQVIATVLSIDTPVCSVESYRFSQQIKQYPDVDMTVVSMDLPFTSERFCAAKGIDNITVASDFADRETGERYGALITEGPYRGLLTRTIFVIDTRGRIVYREIVPEASEQPDYARVLSAVEQALKAASNR